MNNDAYLGINRYTTEEYQEILASLQAEQAEQDEADVVPQLEVPQGPGDREDAGEDPSRTWISRFGGTSVRTSTVPLGQRISMRSARAAAPSPKWIRGSEALRYEPPPLRSRMRVTELVVTMIRAPTPSRLERVPVSANCSRFPAFGESFRSKTGGWSSVVSNTSMSPSLS